MEQDELSHLSAYLTEGYSNPLVGQSVLNYLTISFNKNSENCDINDNTCLFQDLDIALRLEAKNIFAKRKGKDSY